MEHHCFAFKDTGIVQKLILDYLDQQPELVKLTTFPPDIQGINQALAARKNHPVNRRVLVDALVEQYGPWLEQDHPVAQNLEHLRHKNTFTITTGHQLVLFGGPLYFVYKILHTVALSRQMAQLHPDKRFVPVFWMASEDHDLAEVDHFYGPSKVRWHANQTGAVGRMELRNMEDVYHEVSPLLGTGPTADELKALFASCYLKSSTLAEATRTLVQALFGHLGVVVVDGDDANLKALVAPLFERELREGVVERAMAPTNAWLEKEYHVQVNPRPINLFFLEPGGRHRIEKTETGFVAGSTVFEGDHLFNLLKSNPEAFSPNVTLRPVYQELILPNLAYVGGGGELAYWLQLKGVFEALNVLYQAVILGHSALFADAATRRKMEACEADWVTFFKPLHEQREAYIRRHTVLDVDLANEQKTLEALFDGLEQIANQTDASMKGAVAAQRAKQLKGLENLRKKLLRAEKRKYEVAMARLDSIHAALYPDGSLQERRLNFSLLYLEQGSALFERLLNAMDQKESCTHLFLGHG